MVLIFQKGIADACGNDAGIEGDTDTLAHQQFGWRSSLFAADEGQDSQHFESELTGMSISLVTKKVS